MIKLEELIVQFPGKCEQKEGAVDEEQARSIKQLKEAYEAGIFDGDTYRTILEGLGERADYTATADQGGTIAQDHSVVATGGSAAVGGNVGGSIVMGSVYVGEPVEDPKEALRIYRQVLVNSSTHLPLRGVDVGASDPATAKKLGLANVYVDLDTTSKIIKVTKSDEADLARAQAAGEEEKFLARYVDERVFSVLNAAAENRRLVLTGDPGGGKSTFVNHLAFCLAAHTLYPAESWLNHLPEWPESEANLLPIVITLRDFAAMIDESRPGPPQPKTLWDFVLKRLDDQNLSFTAKAIQRELRKGQVMIFLDGLDEVPGTKQRKYVRDAVTAFADNYPGNRFLVTCRILSYQPPDDEEQPDLRLDLENFPVYEIAPFDEGKIDHFIKSWYAELERIGSVPGQAAGKLARRLMEAVRRPDLWRLAPNPLLLTVMSLVHAHEGRLPDARALLYERTVDMLLWRWEEVKSGGAEKIPTLRQLLMDAGRADLDLKRLLWRLAFEAHSRSSDSDPQEELGDISEAQLTHALEKLKRDDWQWAHLMVEAMKLRAGLLLEREPGVFTFPHRTFQEYLAGAYLSTQKDFSTKAVDLGSQGALWREPLLLGAGRLVHVAVDVDKSLTLVNRLCPAREPLEGRNVWLAADVLREVGLERARDDEWGRELLGRVQMRLTNLVGAGYLTPRERAEAGETLAEIGDPRPGVVTLEPNNHSCRCFPHER